MACQGPPHMTFTELRQQILANAMKTFTRVVKEYVERTNNARPKPEDVYDIVTSAVADDSDREVEVDTESFQAPVTHGEPWQFQEALAGPVQLTRYDALLQLLACTEILLAEMSFGNGKEQMIDRTYVQQTKGVVERALLDV